jgi:hypothetical protein
MSHYKDMAPGGPKWRKRAKAQLSPLRTTSQFDPRVFNLE